MNSPGMKKESVMMSIKLPQREVKPSVSQAEQVRKMAPTLGQAVKLPSREPQQAQGKGGEGKGSVSRPGHESYYQAVPSGGIAPPQKDQLAPHRLQQQAAVKRSRSMSI